MNKKSAVLVAVGFFAVLFVLSGVAGAQEKKSLLYSIEEIVVKPAMAARFEAAVKKEIELGYPYAFECYSTNDFHYYFLVPIENYAGIDALNKTEGEWAAKMGKEYQALMKSVEGTFEYFRSGVVRFLPELSYAPKKPRLKPQEEKFINWGLAYVEFGKEKEFADVCKQFVEICTSKGTSIGWNMFMAESGTEMPFYFWAETGKSPADYYTESERNMKKIGEEKNTELWGKLITTLRKFEFKAGGPRPDLSKLPKK
jgi:hypothetical protein